MRQITFFIICFNSALLSQNLVPNPGFEEINDTIHGFMNSDVEFMIKVEDWKVPNTTTPDVITPEFKEGFIQPPSPHSGSNMVGIQCPMHRWKNKSFWSECIGVKLLDSLIPNHTYYVEYWIRRSDCTAPSIDQDEFMNENFGILFTPDAINSTDPDMLPGPPHIKGNPQLIITNKEWVKISNYFTPIQKYSYLYLGQFKTPEQADSNVMLSYYLIDDVSVVELTDFELLDKKLPLPVGSIIPLNHVHFISGTTKLSDHKSHEVLEKLAKYLKSNPSIRIRINGHTDSKGNEKSNQLLSEKRARAINQILVKKGISSDRIEWKGFGEENPIADNNTSKGRSKNRRVEFEIIK